MPISKLDFPRLERQLKFLKSEDGRPVQEDRADPSLWENVPSQLERCPYSGSRKNHVKPMNVTALQGVFEHFDSAVALTLDYRERYLAEQNKPEDAPSVEDLFRISWTLKSIPLLVLAEADGKPVTLPNSLAAVFKIFAGITMALDTLVEAGISTGAFHRADSVDADTLYEFIEDHGLLIGPRQVCAGPEQMIRSFLKVLCEGVRPQHASKKPSSKIPAKILAKAPADTPDFERLRAFSATYLNWQSLSAISTMKWLYILENLESAAELDSNQKQIVLKARQDWEVQAGHLIPSDWGFHERITGYWLSRLWNIGPTQLKARSITNRKAGLDLAALLEDCRIFDQEWRNLYKQISKDFEVPAPALATPLEFIKSVAKNG